MKSQPGLLAIRALNQYRRRDVYSYLGLRYYLENIATRTDAWAQNVAKKLVASRTTCPYFSSFHYKELSGRAPLHRRMYIPGPNEALAEAALLGECSGNSRVFRNLPCVFSYDLARGNDRSGIFEYYSVGLRNRHRAIADACDGFPKGVVRYTDIRRFYPSISAARARRSWFRFSEAAGLNRADQELGDKLLSDHKAISPEGEKGVLTGPMFTHLIGNLVLRDLDEEFSKRLKARYFRYVDDMTLVGSPGDVADSAKVIRDALLDLDFELHPEGSDKHFEISTTTWLEGRNDFQESGSAVSWMTLIGNLKRFLLKDPDKRDSLQRQFRDASIRIPVYDYSAAAHEVDFLTRLSSLATLSWVRRKAQEVTPESLLAEAKALRTRYQSEMEEILSRKLEGFQRKRSIPKLRYRAGRLIYLADAQALISLAERLSGLRELHFHSEIMKAVASGNVDPILNLGTDAAQATAQPLRASGIRCSMSSSILSEVQEQAFSVLLLNGVKLPITLIGMRSELLRFAAKGSDAGMMRSGNPFLRELACLHGLSSDPRHTIILERPFDEDEDLAIDAVGQLLQSVSI